MFRTIMVGTDGSDTASRAVRHAAGLASETGAQLHIVSAYGPAMREDFGRLRHGGGSVQEVLEEAAASVSDLDIEVETHELTGDPGAAIVSLAPEIGADLVVVGNKGLGGVTGRLLGSVPNTVVKDAPCSVLVIRTTD